MKLDQPQYNYFKNLFGFGFNQNGKNTISSIFLRDKCWQGEYFIDSFTYTPFIDYAFTKGNSNTGTGCYADEYLTKYNTGWFNVNYHQVDQHRKTLTERMFSLRDLEKDLYDAKIEFREAVKNQDRKTYVHTLCEHLVKLFARMSNIRMCHEIYGFNPPHAEWEGILALDIWYQMLYKEIDASYPFDELYFNMNPMSKLKIVNNKVKYKGREYSIPYSGAGIKIFTSDGENGIEEGYALLWDDNIW